MAPDGGDDALSPDQELPHKFETNPSARSHDELGGEILVCIQDIGNLVHRLRVWQMDSW